MSDHKFVVLECLSKMMNLIIDTGRDYINEVPGLSIDKYRGSHNMEDTPYYDTRIEMLQKDIDLLEQKYKQKIEEVNSFHANEVNFVKQKEKYLKRIDELERNIDDISTENSELGQKIRQAKQKLEEHGITFEETKTVQSCSPFLEVKYEKLKRESQIKDQMYEMEKGKVDILNEREHLHSKEKERYLRRIKELDGNVDCLVSMNNGLNDKLVDALEQLESQSIKDEYWEKREKKSKKDYEKMKKETDEYRTKVDNFLIEMSKLVEEITLKFEHDIDASRKNDGSQYQENESEAHQTHNTNTEQDPILLNRSDVHMEEIRSYLIHVKGKLRKDHNSDSQDAEGKRQIGEEAGDNITQEMGLHGTEEFSKEIAMLKEENHLLNQELKTLKETKIVHGIFKLLNVQHIFFLQKK